MQTNNTNNANKQTNKQTNIQTNIQTNKQTNKQTNNGHLLELKEVGASVLEGYWLLLSLHILHSVERQLGSVQCRLQVHV